MAELFERVGQKFLTSYFAGLRDRQPVKTSWEEIGWD